MSARCLVCGHSMTLGVFVTHDGTRLDSWWCETCMKREASDNFRAVQSEAPAVAPRNVSDEFKRIFG